MTRYEIRLDSGCEKGPYIPVRGGGKLSCGSFVIASDVQQRSCDGPKLQETVSFCSERSSRVLSSRSVALKAET